MPTLVTNLEQQQQAAASARDIYPTLPNQQRNRSFVDTYNRQTVNPTNAVALYTTSLVGSGTATIASSASLHLTTDANLGDLVNVSLDEFPIALQDIFSDENRNIYEINVVFDTSGTNTSIESFIGLSDATSLTGIPTTARHIGIFVNKSASNNWILTGANASTQVTQDTGEVADGTDIRLQIIRTGLDDVIIRAWTGADFTTLAATLVMTDTGFGSTTTPMIMQYFIETETTAARTLRVQELEVKWT